MKFENMSQIDMDQRFTMNEDILKSLYAKSIELMNTDEVYFYYKIGMVSLDFKKIAQLKKHGYRITSIYPNFGIGDHQNMVLEVNLKWMIK